MSKSSGKPLLALASVLALSSCGSAPEGAGGSTPAAATQDERVRLELGRRSSAEWMRGGAWRIVGTGVPGRPVAIALSGRDARLLIPTGSQGYDIHRGDVDCRRGDFPAREAMRSASDGAPPALRIEARPPAYAGEAVREFCAQRGTPLRGGVPQALRAMRDGMGRDGGMGASGLKGIRP